MVGEETLSVNNLANFVALPVRGSWASQARGGGREPPGEPRSLRFVLFVFVYFTENKRTLDSPQTFGGTLWLSAPSRSIWRAARWLGLRSVGHNLIRTSHPRRAPPSLSALHHRPFEEHLAAQAPCVLAPARGGTTAAVPVGAGD